MSRIAATVIAVGLALGALAGCGADEEDAATVATAVTGSVVQGGRPASGVEVVLMGWRAGDADAVQLSSSGQRQVAESGNADDGLEELGRATADEQGRFVLEVEVADLTARASSTGLVDARVQVVGHERAAVPATIRVDRDPGTGVAQVGAAQEMLVELP